MSLSEVWHEVWHIVFMTIFFTIIVCAVVGCACWHFWSTYASSVRQSPFTFPVGVIALLSVTFTYMSAWPELRTLVWISAFIAVHIIWRVNTYNLTENKIADDYWDRILKWHIGTNVIFGVILGICVAYNIVFNWWMFVTFFFLSTALAMNESIHHEKNVSLYARHMVYHCIMCSNVIWYNRNIESMLFRMYRNIWGPQEDKHNSFMHTSMFWINVVIELIAASMFVRYNVLTISWYLILPFLVSLLVWSWDFSKGFWKGSNWNLRITRIFCCFVLVYSVVNPEPKNTCNINYSEEYVVEKYDFDVSINGKISKRDVNVKVTVGPTFRDVKVRPYGNNENVQFFNNQFDTDLKRTILGYEMLRNKHEIGCELQVEWRVNNSWIQWLIPHLPVLKTGEEWPLRWLNFFGTPISTILSYELNQAEEVKRLTRELQKFAEMLQKINENTQNISNHVDVENLADKYLVLSNYESCAVDLQKCEEEKERLKPFERNVIAMFETINNDRRYDSNPVDVENLAETYLAHVQKVEDLKGEISTINSRIVTLTGDRDEKKRTLSEIKSALRDVEKGTVEEKVKNIVQQHAECRVNLTTTKEWHETCQRRNLEHQENYNILAQLTESKNTWEMMATVKHRCNLVSDFRQKLDECNRNKITGFFSTPNTSETHTNGKKEAETPTIGKKEEEIHTNGKKEAEKQSHILQEQAQLLQEEAEQAKKADKMAELFSGMPS